MKRLFALIFVFLTVFFISAGAEQNINLFINDKEIKCDTPPMIVDSRTLVPARVVFENFNAKVSWDEKSKKVKIESDTADIVFTIGQKYAIFNRKSVPMDVAPVIINDRTYVPIRFVSEKMGYNVSWDDKTKSVYINSPETESDTEILSVKDESIKGDTYVVIKLNEKVKPKVSTYSDPFRIVLDFPDTKISGGNASQTIDNIYISQMRWATHDDYARVVIQTHEEIKYNVTGSGTDTVKVKIGDTDNSAKEPDIKDEENTDVSDETQDEETNTEAEQEPVFVLDKDNILVAIDAGHGGVDVGAVAHDENGEMLVDEQGNPLLAEKNVNLYIAQQTKKYLEENNIKVLMTRDDDTFEGTNLENLLARTQLANDNNACLFVSIHNNSAASPTATGTEVCYTTYSSGKYGITSKELALNILDPVVSATGLVNRGIVDRPNLAVLKYTGMPAVLIECGFISCETDRAVLMDENKLNDIAFAICQGIMKSLDQMLN